MPNRPPRREPRVLALDRVRGGLRYAVADPWELRGAGAVHVGKGSQEAALLRLIRREKPTLIAACGDRLRASIIRAVQPSGIGVLLRNPMLPSEETATDLFPEFSLFAPTRAHRRTAFLAIAAALEAPITPRLYATSRHHPLPRAAGSPTAGP